MQNTHNQLWENLLSKFNLINFNRCFDSYCNSILLSTEFLETNRRRFANITSVFEYLVFQTNTVVFRCDLRYHKFHLCSVFAGFTVLWAFSSSGRLASNLKSTLWQRVNCTFWYGFPWVFQSFWGFTVRFPSVSTLCWIKNSYIP